MVPKDGLLLPSSLPMSTRLVAELASSAGRDGTITSILASKKVQSMIVRKPLFSTPTRSMVTNGPISLSYLTVGPTIASRIITIVLSGSTSDGSTRVSSSARFLRSSICVLSILPLISCSLWSRKVKLPTTR